MSKRQDLTGQKFGRWRVLEFAGINKAGNGTWLCECVCGKRKPVIGGHLRRGASTSCGCYQRELTRLDHRAERNIYSAAKGRCADLENPHYGGRGIKFLFTSFEQFFAELGPRPAGVDARGKALYSIDRKNNDGNYEPGNVRWATAEQQLENRSITHAEVVLLSHVSRVHKPHSEATKAKMRAAAQARRNTHFVPISYPSTIAEPAVG